MENNNIFPAEVLAEAVEIFDDLTITLRQTVCSER
jgi:hypothetical protein